MTPRHLQVADPLPECRVCEEPTRRQVWEATGGLCSSCSAVIKAARSATAR